ncbi:hypothetical protein BJY04DRAFT_133578 [Aspergillus karnatakaensis]|uniref:uncharacterized protein n=1 Tax=Aspergillus karnatakaensis TaxID=1810916 RepID=UPI003CCCE57B
MENRAAPDHVSPGLPQFPQLEHEGGVNPPPDGLWPVEEDIFFDWDALYGQQNIDLGLSQGDRTSWSTFDSLNFGEPSPTPLGGAQGFDEPNIFDQQQILGQNEPADVPIVPSNFNNVAEWIDGAWRPARPCDHCRRHRLQCLILRRTPDNPNPVPSCSSCVGLFRPCSFGSGEKREPSGFETLSPVLGHLHGLIEEEGDGVCNSQEGLHIPDTKETKQFVRKGARVLREWFYQNTHCPYPTEAEKARLAQETGFTKQRISTWFANARRRSKQQRQAETSTRVYRAGSPMPMPLPTSDIALMTPMERWKASPPDEEPVPESVIQQAIASTSLDSDPSAHRTPGESPLTEASSIYEASSLASSHSSFGIHPSSASDSSSSAWSYQSTDPSGPIRSRPSSSHRRLPSLTLPSTRRGGRKRITDTGRYQCTFCPQAFTKKHDWSRHEKSVHLPLDIWICTPNLADLIDPIPLSQCRFCDTPNPTPDHWETHDFRACAPKPHSERSFSRKDYLWQHLRKFHGCSRSPVTNLDAWRVCTGEIKSRCGFCFAELASFSARADHLAGHFKDGVRMESWVGDWGFESGVLGSLRNAVLPGERRATFT